MVESAAWIQQPSSHEGTPYTIRECRCDIVSRGGGSACEGIGRGEGEGERGGSSELSKDAPTSRVPFW